MHLPPSRILLRAVEYAEREALDRVRETDGPNDSPRIREYLATCGLKPPEPYCACFAKWCIVQACADLRAKLKSPYCDAYTPTFYHNLPLKVFSRTDVIQRGDLFFKIKSSLGRIAHVGFVRTPLKDGVFGTVEGNTNIAGSRDGDGVYLNRRENTDSILFARFSDEHVEFKA